MRALRLLGISLALAAPLSLLPSVAWADVAPLGGCGRCDMGQLGGARNAADAVIFTLGGAGLVALIAKRTRRG